MLKKLRRKFIFTNMLLVTLVLLVVFTVICIVNYQQREDDVRGALKSALAISESSLPGQGLGLLPHWDFTGQPAPDALGTQPDSSEQPDGNSQLGTDGQSDLGNSSNTGGQPTDDGSPLIFGKDASSFGYLPVATYLVSDSGATVLMTQGISLDSSILDEAVASALSAANSYGKLSDVDVYYQRRATTDGTKIAFVSTSYVDSPLRSLIFTLVLVGIATLGLFFLISFFLARWAMKPVERAWAQQHQFVADASHELKTPLTVMLANNSILMDHKEDSIASQMQWVESTQSEALLMQGLIDDMLFLARPEGDTSPLQCSSVNLSDLVERNMLQFESVAFERSIILESHISPGITLLGNESRLQRLVGTLVDNACKYADDGGIVSTSLTQAGENIVLKVTNTGTIIAAEDIPYVFDRFYRSDKARVRDKGGFGLGLAIAHEVVKEHKGSITAASTANSGTVFTVTLPAR